ncbi:MAG: DUF3021 family protein [Eubacteriales bacterium]|nr:DUF3021 family protein [Eubacteriales bacterium]
MSKFKRYVWAEIGIEFKACLYFFAFLFYVCMFWLIKGEYSVSILHMAEMILSTYIMGYVQVFVLDNFDESEKITPKTIGCILLCTMIYTVLHYVLNWTDHSVVSNGGFFLYVLVCYVSVFWVYRLKRKMDTEVLNQDLENFKKTLD